MACEERVRRGHWPRPIAFRLKEFVAQELGFGNPGWRVGFSPLKAFDALQRFGHLCRAVFTVTFTLPAGAGTIRGLDLFAVATQLSLRDAAGWQYFGGLDGRDWIDDYLFRTGRLPTRRPADVVLGASAQQVTIRLPLELRSGVGEDGGWIDQPFDGVIPLAILDDRNNAAAVLLGQWGTTVPTTTGTPITITSIDSCSVNALVYYDQNVHSDAPMVIDVQRSTVKPFVLEVPGQVDGHALIYSMLRHRSEDTGGIELSTDYTNLKVDHGSDNWYAGLTAQQALSLLLDAFPLEQEDDATFATPTPTIDTAYAAGSIAVETLPFMVSPPGATRAQAGAGPITVNWTSTTHTGGIRVNTRIISPASVQYQTEVARLCGISADQLQQQVQNVKAGNSAKIAALLPRSLRKKG